MMKYKLPGIGLAVAIAGWVLWNIAQIRALQAGGDSIVDRCDHTYPEEER